MKLTGRRLKKIIKEEVNKFLSEESGWEDVTDNRGGGRPRKTVPDNPIWDSKAFEISRNFSSEFNKLDSLVYDPDGDHLVKSSSELRSEKSRILPVAEKVLSGAEKALNKVKDLEDTHHQNMVQSMLERVVDSVGDLVSSLENGSGDPHNIARSVRANHRGYDEMGAIEYYK